MDDKNENESREENNIELHQASNQPSIEFSRRLIEAQVSRFSSPLPPPEILKAYDLVSPGLAQAIVDHAMRQGNHRMALEKTVIEGDNRRASRGQILGFILGLLCIASGTTMVLTGHDTAGAGVIVTGATSLVGTFIYGTNSRRDERDNKRKKLLDTQDDDQG
jgi:uncharacterized membrane protein